jgi:predicted TIM-barrel fold metal-dependent hydrolase
MTLIDVHEHIGLGSYEFDLAKVPERGDFHSWIDRVLAVGPAGGQSRVLLPPLYYQTTQGIEDVRRLNDVLALAATRTDLHVAAALGFVEPQHGRAAFDEIDRIARGNLRGIVFSPRCQGVFADIPEMITLVKHAGEHGLVVMTHATPGSANERLWRIWNLAEQCADVKMLALGAFASWENIQQILSNGGKATNLRYDTSGLEFEPITRVIEELGAERILYGSGAHDGRAAAAMRPIDREPFADLPDSIRAMVLHGNAAIFLGLAK